MQCTLYIVQWTLYSEHCMNVMYIAYSVHCTVGWSEIRLFCTVYSVHCTLYSVHYTVYVCIYIDCCTVNIFEDKPMSIGHDNGDHKVILYVRWSVNGQWSVAVAGWLMPSTPWREDDRRNVLFKGHRHCITPIYIHDNVTPILKYPGFSTQIQKLLYNIANGTWTWKMNIMFFDFDVGLL